MSQTKSLVLIAHRGNLEGPAPEEENRLDYIKAALNAGYDVEVDVWLCEGNLFLGHDRPNEPVEISFLKNSNIWAHAKNIEALKVLKDMGVHCFFHNTDKATLTSKGYIWTYPGELLVPDAVCVMPERGYIGNIGNCHAVCSDYVGVEGKYS